MINILQLGDAIQIGINLDEICTFDPETEAILEIETWEKIDALNLFHNFLPASDRFPRDHRYVDYSYNQAVPDCYLQGLK